MGLDMYLTKKRYVWSKDRSKIKIEGIEGVIPEKVKSIEEEAGYWRKANAIHSWFVENIQDGEDDCKEYYVDREKLQELLHIVEEVLKHSELVDGQVSMGYSLKVNEAGGYTEEHDMQAGKVIKDPTKAQELLPTRSGFFFGGTEYDGYYYNDLVETKKIILEALTSDTGADFYYRASW